MHFPGVWGLRGEGGRRRRSAAVNGRVRGGRALRRAPSSVAAQPDGFGSCHFLLPGVFLDYKGMLSVDVEVDSRISFP